MLLHLGEKVRLLVVVMRLDELVPSEGVADKVRLVLLLDVGRLEPDGVEAADDGVVEHGHVACACGEDVGLESSTLACYALKGGGL